MANYPTSDPSFTTKNAGQTIEPSHVNGLQDEVVAIGSALRGTLQHALTLASGHGVTERGRSAAMGEFTAVAHSGGNFTASGSMTWTVASGDQVTYAWAIVGKMLTVLFDIENSTVGGTPSTTLKIAIPGGFTAAKEVFNPIRVTDNSTSSIGYCKVEASATVIDCFKADTSNWTASTDATFVQGQITFEVQ